MPYPIDNPQITQGYGPTYVRTPSGFIETFSTGYDFAAVVGTPVKATYYGKVLSVGIFRGWGNTIRVQDNDGNIHQYGHLSSFNVSPGDTVSAGQVIGLSGGQVGAPGAGETTGPHLSYDVLGRNGQYIDPTNLLNEPGGGSTQYNYTPGGDEVSSELLPSWVPDWARNNAKKVYEGTGRLPGQGGPTDPNNPFAGTGVEGEGTGGLLNEQLLAANLGANAAFAGVDIDSVTSGMPYDLQIIAKGAYNSTKLEIEGKPLTPEQQEEHRANIDYVRTQISNLTSQIEERRNQYAGIDSWIRTPIGNQAARDYFAYGQMSPDMQEDPTYLAVFNYLRDTDETEGKSRELDYQAGQFDAAAGKAPREGATPAYQAGYNVFMEGVKQTTRENLAQEVINITAAINSEIDSGNFEVGKLMAMFDMKMTAWNSAASHYEKMFRYTLPTGAEYVPGFQPGGAVDQIYQFLGAPPGTGVQRATPQPLEPFAQTGNIANPLANQVAQVQGPQINGAEPTFDTILDEARRRATTPVV